MRTLIATTLFMLCGCASLGTPIPTIVTKKCVLPDLAPKKTLPKVSFIKGGNCLYFRCLDEANAKLLQERELVLIEDVNYVRDLYDAMKKECAK